MSVDNRPDARIQLVSVPYVSPGRCGICGISEDPVGFADARLDFEFYGTFYLCSNCTGDYARLFGYLSPRDYAALEATNAALIKENASLTKRLDQLGAVDDAINRYLSSDEYNHYPSNSASVVAEQQELEGNFGENDSAAESADSNPPALTLVEGTDDVSDAGSNVLAELGIE